jgi:hypothetical protein
MTLQNCVNHALKALLFVTLTLPLQQSANSQEVEQKPLLLRAARVFDGNDIQTDTAILVMNGQIQQIASQHRLKNANATVIDFGDATLLPGLIELHAHLAYKNIPEDTVLRHGITTLRDTGGPLQKPHGGDGRLRMLSAGLIITAPNGYPIPGMGEANIAVPVATEEEARDTVRKQVEGGAALIKITLEPGGEAGAPWSAGHAHHHGTSEPGHPPVEAPHKAAPPAWPLLPEAIVKAIVDEAHKQGRIVTAHVGEEKGAKIALAAGVDEWAHVPCAPIPVKLLQQAAAQNVKVVTTLDTLSKCPGVEHNARHLALFGAELLYGAEIAHPDIPWGIDAQELMTMMQYTNMQPLDVLQAATSKAGKHLGIPMLGTLQAGAPADIIAVKGDALESLKKLEYPDFVMSGGKIVVDYFSQPGRGNP